MTDTSGTCQPTLQNLAFYLQGVSVEPSLTITYDYLTTASLPSSASKRRVWQFQAQGTLSGVSVLILDYTAAHIKCPEFNITFEGALNGTFIVHNQTFSANKFISYRLLSTYVLELTLRVPKAITECHGLGTTQNYYFSINLNDAAAEVVYTLNYGMDSSGNNYDYTAGPPDTLTISGVSGETLQFQYGSIASGDVVDVVVDTTTNSEVEVQIDYYNNATNSILFLQNNQNNRLQQQIIYLGDIPNWGLYFKYNGPSTSLVQGGFVSQLYDGTTSEININTLSYYNLSRALSCNFKPTGQNPDLYLVVEGAKVNDLLNVYINNESTSITASLSIYDISGNQPYTNNDVRAGNFTVKLQYGTPNSGWNNVVDTSSTLYYGSQWWSLYTN